MKARSPSGKAEVCKTSIGGSIPPRASKTTVAVGQWPVASLGNQGIVGVWRPHCAFPTLGFNNHDAVTMVTARGAAAKGI